MRKVGIVLKFFFMVFFFSAVSLNVESNLLYAQNSVDDWKNEKITVRVSNEPLGTILEKVAAAANAQLTLQGVTLVNINKPTSINVKNESLDKVLGQLIGDQDVKIRFEANRRIIVEPNKQQQNTEDHFMVSGTVIDAELQEPIVGATVMVTEGTGAGTSGCITDVDGKFSLRIARKSSIRISFIGYKPVSQQILKPSHDLKILLEPSYESIDEVVVTGISKRNKNSFTGNFVTVKGEQLRRLNPTNILKGLQFVDPSFKVVENNSRGSDPNAQPEFQMRGDQSLGSTSSMNSMDLMLDNVSSRPNTPLFVLDGFTVSMNRILELDPERVESITILKDAAATSIYGSRASNGVVVVETKVAPDGALSVSYSGNMIIQAPDLTDYNMMEAAEKLDTEWRAGIYDKNMANEMNEYNRYMRNILAGVNTYWLSQPLRTAIQNRHSLSVAGGTDLFRYSLDLSAGFQPGVMKGSTSNNKSVNFTMSYRKEDFTMGATVSLTETDGKNSPYGSFSQYTRLNPYYRATDEKGEHLQILDVYKGVGSTVITNPLYDANVGIKDMTHNLTIATSLNLEYMILKNLRLTEQLSYTRGMARTERFLPANHTSFATETDLTRKGSYSKNSGEMTSWSSNLGINYNLPLDKHLFSVFANWTVNEDRNNYVNLFATGYPDPHMDDFIFGNEMSTRPSGTESLSRSMGLIGQFSYSYDNRYSVDFNLSGEASSRYSDHSFVPFWSAGVRWNAYREKWLEGHVSNLVFRATYGVTGEQSFSPYEAIEFYTYSGTMKPYTSFPVLGSVLSGLNNPDLGWAKTDNFSFGVDFGFWQNRVNLSFNYYNNITRELLTNYDLAPSTGFSSQTMNAGELQNKGFDASLNVIAVQNVQKQFYWTIGANANHNKNKIRKISDYLRKMNEAQLASPSAPLPVYQEGQSTTTLYAVRSLGIDPITGKEVYMTRDGKKTFTWNAADKVPVGDTNPDVSGTVSTSVNWQDFTCMLGFTYRFGGILYNQTLVDKIENANVANNLDRRAAHNRWENPGDVVRYVKFNPSGAGTPASTRFIMDDNELKLASLNVGYRFRSEKFKFLRNLNVELLSLNFTTNDLLRISPVRMERGLDYPFARSYTFSMSVIFK